MWFKNLRDEYLDISWGFIEILGFLSFLETLIIDFLIIVFSGFYFNILFNRTGLLYIVLITFAIVFFLNLKYGKLEEF